MPRSTRSINSPRSVRRPRIKILAAGEGPNVTMRLAANYADIFNFGVEFPVAPQAIATLRDRCEEIGRDPATIELQTGLNPSWPYLDLRNTYGQRMMTNEDVPYIPPEIWAKTMPRVELIAGWRDLGMDELILAPPGLANTDETMDDLIEDVGRPACPSRQAKVRRRPAGRRRRRRRRRGRPEPGSVEPLSGWQRRPKGDPGVTSGHRRVTTDVAVESVGLDFRDVPFDQPLTLSSGMVDGYTLALAKVSVRTASGDLAMGVGAGVLAVTWSWPNSGHSIPERDSILRQISIRSADLFTSLGRSDPVTLYKRALRDLPSEVRSVRIEHGVSENIPDLAAGLAIAPIDNAIHDAWARAAGLSAYRLYAEGRLRNVDPGALHVRRRLPVQHVVGIGDQLTSSRHDVNSVEDWIGKTGSSTSRSKSRERTPTRMRIGLRL